ncbi:Putative molybdenum carrier [Planctomycetes bacterium Pan216]|uniref:Molybdenum carrier n=1 Tax=Kolteria novifilia TaxID=2527975 RepID=A0A518B2A1_9BACT|nr:Putative molybdenum carrier [Planctomycetes bacterium Pan216]
MLRKIVSGGQTGVDRAALEAAIALNIAHGGWCPKGRRAEDGTVPSRYELVEADSRDYAVRTERNVVDSDGTLIVAPGELSGGTALTAKLCRNHEKPLLVLSLEEPAAGERFPTWLAESSIEVLNVAGPRESEVEGESLQVRAEAFLVGLLARVV